MKKLLFAGLLVIGGAAQAKQILPKGLGRSINVSQIKNRIRKLENSIKRSEMLAKALKPKAETDHMSKLLMKSFEKEAKTDTALKNELKKDSKKYLMEYKKPKIKINTKNNVNSIKPAKKKAVSSKKKAIEAKKTNKLKYKK